MWHLNCFGTNKTALLKVSRNNYNCAGENVSEQLELLQRICVGTNRAISVYIINHTNLEQIYLFLLKPNGAVLFIPFDYK